MSSPVQLGNHMIPHQLFELKLGLLQLLTGFFFRRLARVLVHHKPCQEKSDPVQKVSLWSSGKEQLFSLWWKQLC